MRDAHLINHLIHNDMQLFKINDKFTIVCEAKSTRNGFKHVATLFCNGSGIETNKCCYLNRTWEAWRFQTVVLDCINKSKFLSNEEKEEFKKLFNH